jgi:hypothetical protein
VKAGLPQCNCHGLRKIGAVRAAEAGASEHELMAMFGWDDASMARVYTRKAAQKKLAASGAAKLGLTKKIVPPSVPPEEKDNQSNTLEEGWCPEEDTARAGPTAATHARFTRTSSISCLPLQPVLCTGFVYRRQPQAKADSELEITT